MLGLHDFSGHTYGVIYFQVKMRDVNLTEQLDQACALDPKNCSDSCKSVQQATPHLKK